EADLGRLQLHQVLGKKITRLGSDKRMVTPRGLRVLVTAGASGIGRTIAETFLAQGSRVHICDVAKTNIAEVVKMVPGVSATLADVADECQVDRLFQEVTDHLGGLDVIVK